MFLCPQLIANADPIVDAPLIDCHAHLNWTEFDADLDAVLARARARGIVGVLCVAMDQRDAAALQRFAERSNSEHAPQLRVGLGVHPICAGAPSTDLDDLARLFARDSALWSAVGECGLDYSTKALPKTNDAAANDAVRAAQHAALERQIAIAIQYQLPLNVHSRSAGHHAIDFICQRLANVERARRPPVLMHAFDGKPKFAQAAVANQEVTFYFSVAPSIVRGEQLQRLVVALPLERLVLESDAPGLGPTLGARNEPANVSISCRAIAHLLGLDVATVARQTTRNAAALFPHAFAGLVDNLRY
jgi:TatD DNase family protein